jgi:hypothetical protein
MRCFSDQIEQTRPGGNAGRANADLADGIKDLPDHAGVRGWLGGCAAQVDHDLRGPAGIVSRDRELRSVLLEVVR